DIPYSRKCSRRADRERRIFMVKTCVAAKERLIPIQCQVSFERQQDKVQITCACPGLLIVVTHFQRGRLSRHDWTRAPDKCITSKFAFRRVSRARDGKHMLLTDWYDVDVEVKGRTRRGLRHYVAHDRDITVRKDAGEFPRQT